MMLFPYTYTSFKEIISAIDIHNILETDYVVSMVIYQLSLLTVIKQVKLT